MTDEKYLAQQVYKTLCSALDRRDWEYEKDEEKLLVHFGVNGDDIPMNFVLLVDEERQLIRLLSQLPFKIKEEKRIDGAIAACAVTYRLVDGSFDYDLSDGTIVFRMTASFRKSVISDGLFQYMISCACDTIDAYNDRFMALDKGLITIEDFLQK